MELHEFPAPRSATGGLWVDEESKLLYHKSKKGVWPSLAGFVSDDGAHGVPALSQLKLFGELHSVWHDPQTSRSISQR
jgi:hypothetical protein